ncbi:MAG: ATP-binding protein [Anaerolineales bacterium]|nr:ATP-binding protein [Anaerolineales bacterium]
MKQLVILSGKGGTGKTSVAAAFAHLAHQGTPRVRAILADADVDAANLELVLRPSMLEEHDFPGGSVAVIDENGCQGCGICAEVCRFEAITAPEGGDGEAYLVDPVACDGCAACVYQCPEQAIHMEIQTAGRWYRSEGRYGPLLHAELFPAQENSGKLVTLVKQHARLLGLDTAADMVIVDGPPGIGCPVISAASGADLALIVAEPTAAGIHDMERVLELARHFSLPCLVCINKADVYPLGSEQIRDWCIQNHIHVAGSIPFDSVILKAMINGEPVTAYLPDSPASLAITDLWEQVTTYLLASP